MTTELPPDLRWFTPKQIGESLHISTTRIRAHIQSGRLTARVHIGPHGSKRLYISEAALRTFVYEYFTTGYWKGKKRPPKEIDT